MESAAGGEEEDGVEAEEDGSSFLELADETSEVKRRRKMDYLVDLWTHSAPKDSYVDMFRDVGKGVSGTVLGVLTTSAHPSPWLAGLSMQMNTFVLTERLSEHSLRHGKDIALKIQVEAEAAKTPSLKRLHTPQKTEYIEPPEVHDDKVQFSASTAGVNGTQGSTSSSARLICRS